MKPEISTMDLRDLNQLIAEMYQESDKKLALRCFLKKLRDLLFFDKGCIYFIKNIKTGARLYNFIHLGWSESRQEEQLGSYLGGNYYMDDMMDLIIQDVPVMIRTSEFFHDSERTDSDYYNEILEPSDIKFSLEGNFDIAGDFVGGISLHRSCLHRDFSDREISLLNLLRPHLSNVSRDIIASSVVVRDFNHNDLGPVSRLDHMAVFIFDRESGKLIKTNVHDVSFIDRDEEDDIMNMIRAFCRERSEDGCCRKMQIRFHGRPFFLHMIADKTANDGARLMVAALFDFMTIYRGVVDRYCRKFSLTRRESDILFYALKGLQNKDISSRMCISVSTVKSHLNSLYRKAGLNGKYEMYNIFTGKAQKYSERESDGSSEIQHNE